MDWIWIELHGFPPYKLLDVILGARWLLEIETEWSGTDWLVVDVVKRCQVWVTKCHFSCKIIINNNNKTDARKINHRYVHGETKQKWCAWKSSLPVIRLLGSKTSIFSSRSTAPGDMFGNLAENCCFLHCGSCLKYLRALLLRRNPRLASSGEPISFWNKKEWTMLEVNLCFKNMARILQQKWSTSVMSLSWWT